MSRNTLKIPLAAIAIAAAGAACAQGAPSSLPRGNAASPFGAAPQDSQAPAEWRPGERTTTVAPAQTPPISARSAAKAPVPPPIRIAPGPRPFVVASACRAGTPLVTLNVVLRNVGSAAVSSRLPLVARDEGAVAWSGRAPVPNLAPGASANVSIPLYPPTYAPRADGTHRFTVASALGSAAAPIAVTLPARVCAGLASRFKASAVLAKSVAAAPAQTSAAGYTTRRAGATAIQSQNGAITPEELRLAGRVRQNRPSPPSDVTSTADPKVCTDHGGLGGGLACAALLPQGRLALVWTWSGTAADGFNIYRVDGGQRTRVGRQANGKDVTLYVIDPVPADGYSGKCYAVSATRGNEESDLSVPACTDAARVMQTATLTPGAMNSSRRERLASTGALGIAPEEWVSDSGEYAAGYDYSRTITVIGDTSHNGYGRLGILFDTGSISSTAVYTARLKLTVDHTKVNQDEDPRLNSNHSTSCIARVGLGTANWWKYPGDWIEFSTATTPRIDQVGPDVYIDVTDIVRGWAQAPKSNFGFVLMGDNESLSGFTNAACWSVYDPASVQLQVQFF